MKKVLFIGFLILSVIGLSVIGVNAHSPIDDNDTRTNDDYGRNFGHCHGDYEDMDYQMVYNRLSDEEQVEVDILLADKISQADLDDLSIEQKELIIDEIKEGLLDYMLENYDIERYPF